ncbi:MAG TPA: CoA pyrophosphatase [Beutenbergiaceae bacterium]|nr:CoA pyrophosphatase [Beutenbergiaceae bacterium]
MAGTPAGSERDDLSDLILRAAHPDGPRLRGMHAFDAELAATYRAAVVLLGFTPTQGSGRPAVDLFLVQRSPLLRVHPGQIALPGGRIEATDATVVDAALRETHEEIGLGPERVAVLGALPPVLVPFSSFVVTPVIGWIDDPRSPGRTDVGEVWHTLRVPVADLVDPDRRRTVDLAGVEASGSAGFEVSSGWVWGFTGNLLDHVLTELGWARTWDTSRRYVMPLAEARGQRVKAVPGDQTGASSD